MASLALIFSSLVTLALVILFVFGLEPIAAINPAIMHLEGF